MTTLTLKAIAAEWDRNAVSRCRQIADGKDISHDKILVPSILALVGNLRHQSVLDVGCGCGFLTNKAARSARNVLGIDISAQMIREARARHRRPNLSFEHISLEALARTHKRCYDICLSNMSVITMPNLKRSLAALSTTIKRDGVVVFSIIHPCFWNVYRHDEALSNFDYWQPHAVVAPFRITLDKHPLPNRTTYFHRSFATYFSCLDETGFRVERLIEPRPPEKVPRAYKKAFPLPRFVVFRARKT